VGADPSEPVLEIAVGAFLVVGARPWMALSSVAGDVSTAGEVAEVAMVETKVLVVATSGRVPHAVLEVATVSGSEVMVLI